MNERKSHRVTFALLDKETGLSELPPTASEEYPLAAWYRTVRETPLEELTIEDICKACRQQIHLHHVVPIALNILESDVLAGEMYDGELLVSLKAVPLNYWAAHADQAQTVRKVLERILPGLSTDDIREDAQELLSRMPPT